jgi:penicillin-binding protein 2
MTDDAPRFRLRIIGVISISLFVALVARLWYLQVLNTEQSEQLASANIERVVRDPAPRGRILDVNGNILVDNKVVNVLKVDKPVWDAAFPKSKSADRTATITKLAIEISRSGRLSKVVELTRLIDNASSVQQVTLAVDVDRDLVLYLGERADQFPGVSIDQALVRDYPYGDLAAHVLGYVGRINASELESVKGSPKAYANDDEIGKTGIEKIFEDELRGTPGTSVFQVTSSERVIREITERREMPIPGHDVWLTIDINLQKLTEQELGTALVQARTQTKKAETDPDITAPAGAAVILDPQSGAVRAMASYPTYSPKDFVGGISQSKYETLTSPGNFSPLTNRATEGQYAPGSTFKPFTAYAAIDQGFMTGLGRLPTVDTRTDDNGIFDLSKFDRCTSGKCQFTNSRDGTGKIVTSPAVDLRKSLTVSSDTYYYRIGAEIGLSKNDRAIQTSAELFGLGRVTGVQLPSEASGLIPDKELKKQRNQKNPTAFPFGDWTTGDNINLAVGQGDVLVTPLQLANAYATLANGGHLFAPNIASQIKALDGTVVRSFEPRELETLKLNPDARQPIIEGLLGVTSWRDPVTGEQGTGYQAFKDVGFDLDKWPIAGKTGTAEVDKKADTALFSAFGPMPDPSKPNTANAVPAYEMVVVLEQSGFGGANAAPVVADTLNKVFNNQVPKAYSDRVLAACAARTAAEIAAAAARGATGATGATGSKGTSGASGSKGSAGATTSKATTTTTPPVTTTRVPLLREGESCP